MSSARKEVFLSKVLTKLYPNPPDFQTTLYKNETQLTEENIKETVQLPVPSPAALDKSNNSHLKVYTVSLPPDDYIPSPQTDLKAPTTEDSDLNEDKTMETRRRHRRKKKVDTTHASTHDKGQSVQETLHPPQKMEGEKMNKNKKRKLQRRRQKERLQAEGLWTKGRKCQTDVCLTEDHTIQQMDEKAEEDQEKRREDLRDFLQATQELYFSDSMARCSESAPMVEQILEIMDQIKSGAMPFSEVQLLHHLKSLLLLQDIERLNNSLDSFKEQSSLPLDLVRALCTLFDYWITNILPIKTSNPTK
ncbi:hypothetical protein GDO81_007809 [Engystomops pustulosus]|uniref:Glutamate-rich protein 1 n=1 Tax=Engystomops pustulosus TaxID=76066 RepID=A0AAV7CA35_ENGPU|nr:hypothetical protein GDO81_007809 [Engystomops pustulosus]